jgi:hypothetical protein
MSARHPRPARQLQAIRHRIATSYRQWNAPLAAAEFRTATEFAKSHDMTVVPALPSGPATTARIHASQQPLSAFLDMAARLGGGVLYLGYGPDAVRGGVAFACANGVTPRLAQVSDYDAVLAQARRCAAELDELFRTDPAIAAAELAADTNTDGQLIHKMLPRLASTAAGTVAAVRGGSEHATWLFTGARCPVAADSAGMCRSKAEGGSGLPLVPLPPARPGQPQGKH